MWNACSPGGRFFASSLMVTPLPPLASLIVAVPTLCPWAFFNSTVLEAAKSAIALKTPVSATARHALVIFSPYDEPVYPNQRRFSAALYYFPPLLTYHEMGQNSGTVSADQVSATYSTSMRLRAPSQR